MRSLSTAVSSAVPGPACLLLLVLSTLLVLSSASPTCCSDGGWWPLFRPSPLLYSEFPEHQGLRTNRRAYAEGVSRHLDSEASSSEVDSSEDDFGWPQWGDTNSLEESGERESSAGRKNKKKKKAVGEVVVRPQADYYPMLPVQKKVYRVGNQMGPWKSLVAMTEVTGLKPPPKPKAPVRRPQSDFLPRGQLPSSRTKIVRKFKPASRIYFW